MVSGIPREQCELTREDNELIYQHISDHTVRDGASNYFMQSGGGGIEKKWSESIAGGARDVN